MTQVDDLEVGMYVAVSDWLGYTPRCHVTGEPHPIYSPEPGKPWKIASLSLPFALLESPQGRMTIDLRYWGLTKVSRRYARACRPIEQAVECECEESHQADQECIIQPDRHLCPRCRSGRMVEQLVAPGCGLWHRLCKTCGYEEV